MDNMLTNFIEKILSLGEIRTFQFGTETYAKAPLVRITYPAQSSPVARIFNTLLGLVEYCKNIKDDTKFISVASPVEVNLFGGMDPDNDNIQFHYAKAQLPVKNFNFNAWHELEEFIIGIMGMFDETEDKDLILSILSNLANEHVVQNVDNKMSQSLQVKTGITTKSNSEIKNPVVLKPYRTFREVAQPSSGFILRYKNQGSSLAANLFEADGGAWQLDAISNIKTWLKAAAPDVTIIG